MYYFLLKYQPIGLVFFISFFSFNCVAKESIEFWNGNKSSARQQYEFKILKAALDASKESYGDYQISNDLANLPSSKEESEVFRIRGADVFVTVAGNPKLKNQDKIIVTEPLMKGLLGYRLLIVRRTELSRFAAITTAEAFKQLTIGIPQGWADAELFRHNGYRVVEGGSYDQIFDRLADNKFDYIALGANEIEMAFKNRAESYQLFTIEPTTIVYYPFPLVFYVNPENSKLAERLSFGLKTINKNGKAEQLFKAATSDIVDRLGLNKRKIFSLENPILPTNMQDFRSTLL